MGVSGKENDRHDYYFKKAKAEHYRARSIYKLKELHEQFKLFRKGMTVVDLGAAPGSWTQYAAEQVGSTGRVVGIDRQAMEGGMPAQVTLLQMDLLEVSPEVLRGQAGVTQVDVVISDMAPNTSGIRSVDHARSVELCRKAMQVAELILSPGGSFVCKIFQGEDVPAFALELKPRFAQVKTSKPKSSKDESVEIFLVGKGFVGGGSTRDTTGGSSRPGWSPLDDP